MSSFCSAKATHIFSAKNIRILCIEPAKTVNEITLNELVKLMTFWTTGPWLLTFEGPEQGFWGKNCQNASEGKPWTYIFLEKKEKKIDRPSYLELWYKYSLGKPHWCTSDETHKHMSQRMTKPTKLLVRPAKTQISLDISPVWSESLLSAWRKLGSLATHWTHSQKSDQTRQMPRLIWVFAGHTCHFVGFVMHCLYAFMKQ